MKHDAIFVYIGHMTVSPLVFVLRRETSANYSKDTIITLSDVIMSLTTITGFVIPCEGIKDPPNMTHCYRNVSEANQR